MNLRSVVWLVPLILAYAEEAHADYGDVGPSAVTVATNQPTAGGATSVSVVVPSGNGPFPLLVLSHGFSASLDNQVGWGKHFASYGFVAVVPSFPSPFSPNHATNAAIIKQLIALYSNSSTASAAQGKVDATHVGIEGHSAGGLATALAATPTIGAVVLFDPVDANDLGKTQSPSICSPTLALFAGPSACNNQAGWKGIIATQSGPLTYANVVASNHCDGENAPRTLCGPFCGASGADTGRQKVYARWATAFFLARLKNDAAAQTALAGIATDVGLSGVTSQTGTPCPAPVADAGVDGSTIADAGADAAVDASATKDGGPPKVDASAVDGGAGDASLDGTSGTDGGCSCTTAGGPSSEGTLPAIALSSIIALFARRSRRRVP